MAVGDCSVTERRGWRPPYQTGKTVHVHAKHYKHEDGRTAPGVCSNGSALLSHSGNVVTKIGIHTHNVGIHTHIYFKIVVFKGSAEIANVYPEFYMTEIFTPTSCSSVDKTTQQH